MANSAYATPADLSAYLRDGNQAQNSAVWTTFLNASSRFIDEKLGQVFYDDGQYVRYFDGDGRSTIDTNTPFFGSAGTIAACLAGATSLTYTASPLAPRAPAAGDVFTIDVGTSQEQVTVQSVTGSGPYTITLPAGTAFAHSGSQISASTVQVKLAFFENQPQSQWTVALSGDGVTPPSNYFCYPRAPRNAGSSATGATTLRRPWYGLDIATIPISATTYLPSSIPGKLTISINAHWGWPAVPDLIKDLCLKLAARAWRARDAGWSESLGTGEFGVVQLLKRMDPLDEFLLLSSEFVNTLW